MAQMYLRLPDSLNIELEKKDQRVSFSTSAKVCNNNNNG